jgi:hypothetical protein
VPNVHQLGAQRFVIDVNDDHRPAHVHVIGGRHAAVFQLHCPGGPPELRENFGFSRARLNRIVRHLRLYLSALCRAWREIHGDY